MHSMIEMNEEINLSMVKELIHTLTPILLLFSDPLPRMERFSLPTPKACIFS